MLNKKKDGLSPTPRKYGRNKELNGQRELQMTHKKHLVPQILMILALDKNEKKEAKNNYLD